MCSMERQSSVICDRVRRGVPNDPKRCDPNSRLLRPFRVAGAARRETKGLRHGCERGVIPDIPITIDEVTPDATLNALLTWIRGNQ
jgi:hypothetical protein